MYVLVDAHAPSSEVHCVIVGSRFQPQTDVSETEPADPVAWVIDISAVLGAPGYIGGTGQACSRAGSGSVGQHVLRL